MVLDTFESHPETQESFFTPEALRKIEISDGIVVNTIQPPELSNARPEWNARVQIPISTGEFIIGAHLAKKAGKPGCGDYVGAFHTKIHGEEGEHLGDLVALMACDGLTTDNKDVHMANVARYEKGLKQIDPEVNWNFPDLVIAKHQSRLFNTYGFKEFITGAVRKIRLAHQKHMKIDEIDKSGGLDKLMESLGWGLFDARADHNQNLYSKISDVYGGHPATVCDWNYRAPHGQVVYYFPNPQYVSRWDHRAKPLSHRLQSLADVFASPVSLSGLGVSSEVAPSNVNLLTDSLIDELLEKRIPPEEFSKALKHKLETQFDAFPVNLIDHYGVRRSGKVVHYPSVVDDRVGGSINTDGSSFKKYRRRIEEKPLWQIGMDNELLTNKKKSVKALSESLNRDGYVIDDRGQIAFSID